MTQPSGPGCCDCLVVILMTDDELRAWAMKAWKKEAVRNMPAAKAVRQVKAGQRESRKALLAGQRSLAGQQSSTKRELNARLAAIEQEFKDLWEAQDRKFDELSWQLAMGNK